MVTAAVSEGAKGKDMLLGDLARNPLVAVHLLGSETQHNALLEENAQLKAELEDVKRKARRDSEKVLHATCDCSGAVWSFVAVISPTRARKISAALGRSVGVGPHPWFHM